MRWAHLKDDSRDFLRAWGLTARDLGWDALDLFGAHPAKPLARLDCAGLVIFLKGHPVVAMTEDTATIRVRDGVTQTFTRPQRPGPRVAVWELAQE